jgi:8-oxo-dGTP pyrophosphatase MutT (NUDIX family)
VTEDEPEDRNGPRRLSGDGFITVADGSARWGRFGAAGVLARHLDGAGQTRYFVARRSVHTHRGGTWAIPGGALDDGESPVEGALREFREEIGIELAEFAVGEIHEDDHGGWSYWTVMLDVPQAFEQSGALGWETAEARWVLAEELRRLDLFDAFRATLIRIGLL